MGAGPLVRPCTALAVKLSAAFALLAASCVSTVAAAEPLDEPIVLDYRAPSGCPAREQFLSALREASRGVREAQPGETARQFAIIITARGSGFAGSLVIRAAQGETARTLQAASCAEMVRALVLVAKLALDPHAADAGSASEPSEGNAPPSTAKPPEAASGRAPASSPSAELASEDAASSAEERAAPLPPLHARLRGHVGAGLLGAMAPSSLWSLRAGGELEWTAAARTAAPAVRLSLEYGFPARFDAAGGSGHFRYLGGNLELCPLGLRAEPVLFRVCAAADLGLLRSWSSGVPNPDSASRPWVDIGPGARLASGFGRLRLELGLGWIFPLVRDRYLVADAAFYRTAASGPRAGLELSYQFL